MRTSLLIVLAALSMAACNTSGGACKRYVVAYNDCSEELGNGASIGTLSADLVCATFNLPGLGTKELADEFACLADAYEAADCSSEEAFADTINEDSCGVEDDSDLPAETDL
jgi:hypothetical protein